MTLTLAELCNIIRLQLGIHHVQPQDYLFAELHEHAGQCPESCTADDS